MRSSRPRSSSFGLTSVDRAALFSETGVRRNDFEGVRAGTNGGVGKIKTDKESNPLITRDLTVERFRVGIVRMKPAGP